MAQDMSVHIDSIADISRVLAQLRRTRTVASEGEIGSGARVATLNFIVFVDDPEHRPWVLERAQRIADKHPSRLIVLDGTSSGSGVDVSTSARQTAGATVINERVDVAVENLDHASIRSLTQELTAPDVPTVLWWSGARLLQSRTFKGLAELASGVLVDSSGKARDEETIRELGEFVARFPNVALSDLAFMRLLPWQDMIAQFFDDPALRESLFSLTSLRIESGSEAEALYLGAWLGSRLSWEVADRDTFRTRDGRLIPFEKIQKGDQRRVLSVALTSTDSRYLAALSECDPGVACLSVTGARAKPTWCMPLQSIDNTSLIERAILQGGADRIFESSLLTVRDLLG
jgi:glucose-6-phosphate dehydrogenase assembly protein OpcA